MKLTLTNNDGVLLASWSIAGEPEFDIEDLDVDPEHDFYLANGYNDPETVGEIIWKEVWFHYNKGEK